LKIQGDISMLPRPGPLYLGRGKKKLGSKGTRKRGVANWRPEYTTNAAWGESLKRRKYATVGGLGKKKKTPVAQSCVITGFRKTSRQGKSNEKKVRKGNNG